MNRTRRPPPINPAISNPIQQPPHTAGTPLAGLRTKLDPAQIPSTAAQFYADEERWTKESYLTVGEQPVPLSASEYHAIDQGTWLHVILSYISHICVLRKFNPEIYEANHLRSSFFIRPANPDTCPIWDPYHPVGSATARRSPNSSHRLRRRRTTKVF